MGQDRDTPAHSQQEEGEWRKKRKREEGGSRGEKEGRGGKERLRWVKTGSERIIRDTKVYEESATICGSGI